MTIVGERIGKVSNRDNEKLLGFKGKKEKNKYISVMCCWMEQVRLYLVLFQPTQLRWLLQFEVIDNVDPCLF